MAIFEGPDRNRNIMIAVSSGGGNPRDHLPLRIGPFVRNHIHPSVHRDAGLVIRIGKTGSVAHQAASRDELAILVDRGHRVAERQCGELFASAGEQWITADHERA